LRALAAALGALALSACQFDPPTQGARDVSVPALTEQGNEPLRVGMSLAEARQASGQSLNAPAIEEGVPRACSQQPFRTTDGDQLWLMFEGDRLVRITAGDEAPRTRTLQNVGVGSTDAEVRTAYQGVIEEPAKYDPPPAHDLIVWAEANRSGLRFEVDAAGRVARVHAGGPEILYVEGCA